MARTEVGQGWPEKDARRWALRSYPPLIPAQKTEDKLRRRMAQSSRSSTVDAEIEKVVVARDRARRSGDRGSPSRPGVD
jgi:hypothetical protein